MVVGQAPPYQRIEELAPLWFENADGRDCEVFQRLIGWFHQESNAGIAGFVGRQIVGAAVERLAIDFNEHELLVELDLNVIGVF